MSLNILSYQALPGGTFLILGEEHGTTPPLHPPPQLVRLLASEAGGLPPVRSPFSLQSLRSLSFGCPDQHHLPRVSDVMCATFSVQSVVTAGTGWTTVLCPITSARSSHLPGWFQLWAERD